MYLFRRDERAQIIVLTGFLVALAIVAFATVFFAGALAGQETIKQEADDSNFVYGDLIHAYGQVLKQISSNGTTNPFTGAANLNDLGKAEQDITALLHTRGYVVVFYNHSSTDYSSSAKVANATILLSNGVTTYTETVMYDLTNGNSI
ncbi:MAG: hypothetical protein SVM80_00150 [Halobacteriota archaeon]|nr:hypothetical protein [Halobacteriota archaeon]